MPRDIPVGNGDLLITFDHLYQVRDLYFPHVGWYNHTEGAIQRFGVWADGRIAWMDDPGWTRTLKYKPDTLVTDVTLVHEGLGLEIKCEDAVDFHEPVYFRVVSVRDLSGKNRDVRVFFHWDPSIRGIPVGDTANYDPATASMVFYKDDIYFLFNMCDPNKCGIDEWAIGTKRIGGAEGTWRDAEDGKLGRNAISQGSIDATVGVHLDVPPNGEASFHAWLVVGRSYSEVKSRNQRVMQKGAPRMMARTESYWKLWATKEPLDVGVLPVPVRDLFYRSQLVMRTQIDNHGAIIAANDSDIQQFAGDHYSYCWPRDGAMVAYALVLAGQSELSRNFFRYCAEIIEDDGYFLHKYTPTGQLASSWHPWMIEGQRILPIQQDETALVAWALRRHFETFRDVEFIKPLYNALVVRPAEWMLKYRDGNGLPQQSWDLWEERRGIHTFTVAATIGALVAAADFARDFGEFDREAAFREGAVKMRSAMKKYMWHGEQERFCRMARPAASAANGGGVGVGPAVETAGSPYVLDMTADSANFALFAFGALEPHDPRVRSEMIQLRQKLSVRTNIGGCARYERDYYHQVEKERTEIVPGNPWIICTLWQAQWLIASATTQEELREAMDLINWTTYRAAASGVLAEQYHPYTGAPISVSPLTWSHATFVIAVTEWLKKHEALKKGAAGRGPARNAVLADHGV